MTTTALTKPAGEESQEEHSHRMRWYILAILGIAQLMVVLDTTIVNIALPHAQAALGFGNEDRQWIITAYALAFGSLLLLGGRLSDLLGRRMTFMIGLSGFAIASAVAGASVNFEMLVAARAAQGVFGALLAPAALSLLTTTFTDSTERARAFGIFGAIAGGGGALGLLLGGALTEWMSWRWTLYVNLIFAVIAMVGTALFIRDRVRTERPKLDIPGTIVVSAGLFSIVYGFSNAETNGWGNWATIAWLAAGVALVAVFVGIEARSKHPLLPLRVIMDRTRAAAFLVVFILGIGMFAIFLFLTYYLQQNLGYSPMKSGAAFLPMIVGLVITATSSTALVLPRFGPRWLMAGGSLVAAFGIVLLTGIDVNSSYVTAILPGLVITGLGIGAAMAPAMQGAISGVDADDAGVASATVNTMQQIGGSVGTALLSTIASSAAAAYAASHIPATPVEAKMVMAEAAVHSYVTSFWWAAGIFAVGAVIAGTLTRSGKLPEPAEGAVVIGA